MADPAEPPGGEGNDTPSGPGAGESGRPERSPGWGSVFALAAIVLGIVFALEIASRLVPAIGSAFAALPVTIAILLVGTVGVLLLAARRRPGA